MLHRREMLSGAAAAGALAAASRVQAQPAAGAADVALRTLLDRFFEEQVDDSPAAATSLGLDKGARAPLKHRLDPRTAAEKARRLARQKERLTRMAAIDRAALSPASRIDYDVVEYTTRQSVEGAERFAYGNTGGRYVPYVISQLSGAYQDVPDFLDSAHQVRDAEGADAYLDRLRAFAVVMDQDLERFRADQAMGVRAPDFTLDTALQQMDALRSRPVRDLVLVESLRRRAAAAGLDGEAYGKRAEGVVTAEVHPALDRLIAATRDARAKASHDAGCWRLPQGEAFYAAGLKAATTTTLSPDEVHRLGLQQVAEITAELDKILRAQGKTGGTVAQRLVALGDDPAQLYASTEAGRAELLQALNGYVAKMTPLLPRAFETLPKAPLTIRAVPTFIQDGAPNGYYNGASLDGSRPAVYYINLKDTHDWPKFGLPTLTWHEGVPGHHLQISTAQESTEIPQIRRRGGFAAYSEGWALYAEQLADELGVYDGDPLGRAGFLQSFLFRAARLVVDTGMHSKRWSREKATDYLVQATGYPVPRSQREIDRYVVWPGQACSYKIGHTSWARLRKKAQSRLGAKFDLRDFHGVLRRGAMPLTVLGQVVDANIAQRLRA